MNEPFYPSAFLGYEVNVSGIVRSTRLKRIINQRVDQKGYRRVTINIGSKRSNTTVHRIVALTFLEKTTEKFQVNHKNGDKLDNRLCNLEWVTNQENVDHARFILKRKSGVTGERHGFSKLNESDVMDILSYSSSPKELCEKYGVTKSTISSIRRKRSWRYLHV